LPVPVSGIDCGDPGALSKIISVDICGVVFGGVKVTDTLQLFPGLRVLLHCDFTANAPGVTLCITMVSDGPFFFAVFLTFSVFALLVFPTGVVVPKARAGGLTCGGEGIAVAVAVGVAVAVRVALGVGLVVAVAVGVGVRDEVADAVAVAVGVEVGVAAVDVAVGVAVALAAKGFEKKSVRLFAVSAISRSPASSIPPPCGRQRLVALGTPPPKLQLSAAPVRTCA